MCGICGFIVDPTCSDKELSASLNVMTALLEHRGPDSEGRMCVRHNGNIVGLGHRRLSIIDLSENGRQPMCSEDESVHIVYNGEIYNYKQLTSELESKGHRFKSRSDTEAIVHLYEEYGEACVEKLDGMFAFAIWDRKINKLFLARDRIGIKPLFYAQTGSGIVFASEMKAILAMPGITRSLVSSSVDSYLALGYVPGPRTIFHGICALPPGQWLAWKNGTLSSKTYWSPLALRDMHEGGIDRLADEYDALLNNAVKSHLVSDVPVGAFLSGGVDSSLVAAVAAKHMKEPLHTFTIGFSGGADERAYAKTVADHIRSVHHEQMAEAELANELPRLVWQLDQPLFDNSILPTFLVSSLARKHGKVVLSGDGGDEPFGGYGWTRAAAHIPSLSLVGIILGWKWLYRGGIAGFAQRGLFDVTHTGIARYLRRIAAPQSFRRWLYCKNFGQGLHSEPLDAMKHIMRNFSVRREAERYALMDLITYLHEDVLFKVDRMSMAHSLEVRPPLLDHRLVEWSLRLPWDVRCKGGNGKILLRHVASRYLPAQILKPRKQGFTIPIGQWLRGAAGDLAASLFASGAFKNRGIVRSDRALKLLGMHRSERFELGHRIFSLMMFEIWCRIWLDGQSHEQDVSSMLAETGDA